MATAVQNEERSAERELMEHLEEVRGDYDDTKLPLTISRSVMCYTRRLSTAAKEEEMMKTSIWKKC